MQNAIDALADGFYLREIGEICGLEFFMRTEIGRRFHITDYEVGIDRRQQLTQPRADLAGCAGHQYPWHLVPLFQAICGR